MLSMELFESEKNAHVEETVATPLKMHRRSVIRSSGPSETSRLSSETMELKNSLLETYTSEQEKLVSGLSPAKLQALVKVIEGEANFIDGLDYSAESALEAILNELAKQDIHGMASWLKSQYDPKLSDKILEDWFRGQKLMGNREAFAIAEKYMGEKGLTELAGYNMAWSAVDVLVSEDALFYLEYLEIGSSASGSNVKFAEGFDFSGFAERSLERLNEEKEKGSNISSYPSNLFKEWVKADRDEAFAFFEERLYENTVDLPFNEYSDLIEGYIESTPSSESAAWLVEVLDAGDLKQHEYKEVIKKLHQHKLGGIGYTQTVLEHASDPNRLMAEIVAETFHWTDSEQRFAKALQGFDSFEHFLEGAESAIVNHSPMYQYDSNMVKLMEGLERPQVEIEKVKALFKQAEEERREERFKKLRESRS